MMNIKIDKDIPLPEGYGVRKRAKYPFAQLRVGESFAVPVKTSKHLQQYVYHMKKKLKRKFISRTMAEGRESVVRVWRIG